MTAPSTPHKIIHAARIDRGGPLPCYLLLKQVDLYHFVWMEKREEGEVKTPVFSKTVGEALRLAREHWKQHSFRTVNCGMVYTLPERDEHGMNALFYQMTASYSSPNGVFFDDEYGHNCFVNFASQEALRLWKTV